MYAGMLLIYALLIIAAICAMALLLILQFRKGARTLVTLLQFNLAGDGPTKRLFPNLAFLALFILLFKLTWF